jgi:hypothetical protein
MNTLVAKKIEELKEHGFSCKISGERLRNGTHIVELIHNETQQSTALNRLFVHEQQQIEVLDKLYEILSRKLPEQFQKPKLSLSQMIDHLLEEGFDISLTSNGKYHQYYKVMIYHVKSRLSVSIDADKNQNIDIHLPERMDKGYKVIMKEINKKPLIR